MFPAARHGTAEFDAIRKRLLGRYASFDPAGSDEARARTREMFGPYLDGKEPSVAGVVNFLIGDVRQRRDAAILEWTERLDGARLAPATLRVPPSEIESARQGCPAALRRALEVSADRVRRYQEALLRQVSAGGEIVLDGIRAGWRMDPIDSAGIYVPGGTAAYPSSVVMNALPAIVAGVPRVALASPPRRDGSVHPGVLAACAVIGVAEVYRVGGALAIAAFAHGTETIPRVEKVAGPGNAFVTLAKAGLFGCCGVDLPAGPSEVCILADGTADPEWVAADLLSQAEHDTLSHPILVTDSEPLAMALAGPLERRLADLPRREIARVSIERNGALLLVRDLAAGCELVSEIAPEHVEILAADPDRWLPRIRNAGAIFVGHSTPEAVGDYVAGPSHTLPTGGAARYASGLSALDFVRRTSLIRADAGTLRASAPAILAISEAEGLAGHARSVSIRLPPLAPAPRPL